MGGNEEEEETGSFRIWIYNLNGRGNARGWEEYENRKNKAKNQSRR